MWHLNRVGGFRRMELISPVVVYSAAIGMQKAFTLVETIKAKELVSLVTAEDCQTIHKLMEGIFNEATKLNCPAALESMLKPGQLMQQNALTYRVFLDLLKEIDGRFRDEVKHTYSFSLNHAEAALYNPKDPHLGADFAIKFESAVFDVEEAAKCHALGRSTAAAFAFRVLEVGIKALAKCLSVEGLDKPAMKNWGFILREIEKSINAKWPGETDRDSGDGELFWDAYSVMAALKISRNRTMHPAKKYTEQEADRLLRNVADLMKILTPRIDQEGKPKAKGKRVRKSQPKAAA